MARIVVTGGAGFIGAHLCRALVRAGHQVLCLDNLTSGNTDSIEALARRPNFMFMQHDVRQPFDAEAEYFYHLAFPASLAHCHANPVDTLRTCIEGTTRVLKTAHKCRARVLVASSSQVYGNPEEHPQLETYAGSVDPNGPQAAFEEGMRCAETLATAYAAQHRMAVRIARVFDCYGPGMHSNGGRAVAKFITQALRAEPITVHGTGRQTRSFLFVDDLVDGLMRLMKSSVTGPVNLGNPDEQSILNLALRIRRHVGSQSPIISRARPAGDPDRRKPEIKLAAERLGWAPQTPLDAGLRRTIAFFRTRLMREEGIRNAA